MRLLHLLLLDLTIIQCPHCFKQGHMARNCYQLIGYSKWPERGRDAVADGHAGRERSDRGMGCGNTGRGVLGASPMTLG